MENSTRESSKKVIEMDLNDNKPKSSIKGKEEIFNNMVDRIGKDKVESFLVDFAKVEK